ncbi:MAG: GntR family transcriptional regulator [Lachnospiraceae bacterium]|nr:GntR family transcriptional regulator [Lachnospiraceae bacterium]
MLTADKKRAGESTREYALRILKSNIITNGLEPGAAISENELAAQLGISRTPIREALIELAKVSLIETYPQRGSYISRIDPKMVEEARFLRRVLDTAVIEAACETSNEKGLALIEENVSLQEFFLSRDMTERILDLDNEFHRLIYSMVEKDIVYEMSSTLMIHFDRVRSLSFESVKDLKVVSEHRQMLEAIKAGDSSKARVLVQQHLGHYRVDEKVIREQYPDYFK